MTGKLFQPTLTGGELAPALYARTDIARYTTALKRCRNFIVRPSGGVENRNGFYYCGQEVAVPSDHRLIPFVYSTITAYTLFFGPGYIRFKSGGADIAPTTTAYAGGTTYALDAYVTSASIVYRSLQAANVGHTPASSPTWWVADPGLQITSPYTGAQLDAIRYTQSADVLYLTHPTVAPQELRRLTANTFQILAYQNKDGPFIDLNADESLKVAASGVQGTVTITASSAIFTANAVGSLFYIENKNIGQLKPWVVGERGLTVGTLRRSDGKTYLAVTVPAAGTFHETGPRQPIHENGRAWDGPGDTRSNGVDTWSVGVEWEYQDTGYGVVKITSITDSTHAIGTVTKRLPAQVVGGVGAPANTWTRSGDGSTKVFAIAGAGYGVFAVTIAGGGVTPDPNYVPGAPGYAPPADDPYATCPAVDSVFPNFLGSAADLRAGHALPLYDPEAREQSYGSVDYASTFTTPCLRVVTANGGWLDCSETAPLWTRKRGYMPPRQLMGQEVLAWDGDDAQEPYWSTVVDLVEIGLKQVRHITVGNRAFWVKGDTSPFFFLHHNRKPTP